MDDYKKIPFDDPDLCVPDLDDFEPDEGIPSSIARLSIFRYLSPDDEMETIAARARETRRRARDADR